jgi:hypothetical protein
MMKLSIYWTLLVVLQTALVSGQIGIGTQNPDESSIMDIESITKGILIPRLTTDARNQITSPANALLIYNTSIQTIQVNIGTKTNPNWVSIGNSQNSNPGSGLLSAGKLLVGDVNNTAKEVLVSGEATLSNTGAMNLNTTAVISKTLMGYTVDSGPINASHTILQAIQKLDGNQKAQVFTSVTDNYTVQLSDYTLLCDTGAKSFTLSLPVAANCAGKMYIITKIDESYNELIFSPPIQLSKLSSITKLNYSKFFKIQSDGFVWQIIN